MKTLLLDRSTWDLCLDTGGNIAVASNPYSQAQDVASAIRLFSGELWYDTTKGIPYFGSILGKPPPVPFMKSRFSAAALTVPGVVTAQAFLTFDAQRAVGGQVQITTEDGASLVASSFASQSSTAFAVTEDGTPGMDSSGQMIIVG